MKENEINSRWLASFTNKEFELILLMTEQCNFRCSYCYEDFKLRNMPKSVVEGIQNLIDKKMQTDLKTFQIGFFGGEPLLNKRGMIEMSKFAQQKANEYKKSYAANITTNGYSLDKETFNTLIDCGIIFYQVTLDGAKETHDKLRPTINGKPTFDKIYRNLEDIAKSKHKFHCTIRFNIADSNFYSVKKFIKELSAPFQNDERFSFHFHPIFGMRELKLSKTEQLNELKALAAEKNFQFDTPGDSSNDVCYAARADSFVIRSDGRVQKCTVALENDVNTVGKISQDGSINLDQDKLKNWLFADNKGCPLNSFAVKNILTPYEDAGKYVVKS